MNLVVVLRSSLDLLRSAGGNIGFVSGLAKIGQAKLLKEQLIASLGAGGRGECLKREQA